MPKIYDCCMFYNELDMLETRMHILNDVVDYFVVCEAEETHSGEPKPLNLLANWDRFKPWQHKIIYVNAGLLSDGIRNSWQRERYHRSCIASGLTSAQDNDWIIVADCDEIPDPMQIEKIKWVGNLTGAKFELDFYYYDLNHRVKQGWAIGASRHYLQSDPNKIRAADVQKPVILYGGWHFSYFGGAQQIVNKVDAFMHHADPVIRDLPRDPAYIANRVNTNLDLYGRDIQIERVPLADTLPRYILDNQDKYRTMGWITE